MFFWFPVFAEDVSLTIIARRYSAPCSTLSQSNLVSVAFTAPASTFTQVQLTAAPINGDFQADPGRKLQVLGSMSVCEGSMNRLGALAGIGNFPQVILQPLQEAVPASSFTNVQITATPTYAVFQADPGYRRLTDGVPLAFNPGPIGSNALRVMFNNPVSH